jgi:uncharacterized protein
VNVGWSAVRVLGWICGAARLAGRVVLLLSCLGFAANISSAEEVANRTTVVVFGDSQGAGLARGLQRVLIEDQRYRVLNRTHAGAAVVHAESEWLGPILNFVAHEKADVAVAMFGANDRLDFKDAAGATLRFRTDDWRDAYAARIDQLLKPMIEAGLKVIWCGNPIARSDTYSADMTYINDIYAAEAAKFGAQYVPLWTLVADRDGHYAAFGRDRGGVTQRMRADDGIHFTAPGYELIAEKVLELIPPPPTNMP